MESIVLEKRNRERDLVYWQNNLGGELTELNLPFDHPRASMPRSINETYEFIIPKGVNKGMKELAHKENVTPDLFIIAVFKVLLHRYSNEEDICIGTHIANGQEVNTMVMRTLLQEDMSFRNALVEVKKVSEEAYEHQDVSFKEIMTEIEKDNNDQSNRLFGVMLEIRNMEPIHIAKNVPDCKAVQDQLPHVDLTLKVTEVNNELNCTIVYDKERFEKETVIRMKGHFQNLLAGFIADSELSISKASMLTAEERNQLLVEWNQSTVDYPRDSSIDQVFEEQVKLYPDHIALVYGDLEYTYQDLNKKANQIANHLKELGIANEQLVAICLDRSPEMIASILGVLKAGGAYVPIDLNYPKERITYMLNNSKAAFLITNEPIAKELPAMDSKVICLDIEADLISAQSEESISCSSAGSLAYVIYTSGSTGQPKGVEVEHDGIVRLVKNITFANVGPEETFINLTAVSFDVSVFEIYGALLNGGKLVMIKSNKPSFEEIAKTIRDNHVTTLCVIPGILNLLVEDYSDDMRYLRQVLSAGEALPVWLARKFLSKLENCELINAYGPSENSVYSTSYRVKDVPDNATSIPIGNPISEDRAFILDKHLQPVPIGGVGELYLSGAGIARGYLNEPEQTAEVFLSPPVDMNIKGSLYNTGDLACYCSDGNIDFKGRIDGQVKIRGTRIELGEVETRISLFPGVRQSVAGTVENKDGTNGLVAYVVMNQGVSFDQQMLRSYVRDNLPEHMIPTFFVELQEIPVTPVGKIDRKNLPTPTITVSEEIVLPRNQSEETLVKLWEDLLDIRPIGITDGYFELGGNSLLAMQMFAEIDKAFNTQLPVSIIFQEDTIEKLAKLIEADEQGTDLSSPLVPIQPLGSQPPLFCIHGGGGEVLVYGDLALELGDDQPLYGLRFAHVENETPLSVELLAKSYVEEIRKIQPNGPYFIFGYCFGGAIAYEVAQQILNAGEKVASLTILNFANPKRKTVEVRNEVNVKKVIMNNVKLLIKMPLKQKVSFFTKKVSNALKLIRKTPEIAPVVSRTTMNRILLGRTIKVYRPKPYEGQILLIRANEYIGFEAVLGWETTGNGSIVEHTISDEHEALLKDPNVQTVVKYLQEHLEDVKKH